MRVLLLLAAALALAGVAAAAGGGGGMRPIFDRLRSRVLLQSSNTVLEGFSSGSNFIKLTVKVPTSVQVLGLRYSLLSFNTGSGSFPTGNGVLHAQHDPVTTAIDVGTIKAAQDMAASDASWNVYQVTLKEVPVGYYRVIVTRKTSTSNDGFVAPQNGPTDGVAVGMPGDISILPPLVYVPGNKAFSVTINRGLQNTASRYRYRVRKFTSPTNSPAADDGNVVQRVGPTDILTPWTTNTTTFETNTLADGLYSVWVQVEHKDYSDSNTETSMLFKTATTAAADSFAIGAPNQPTIRAVVEPNSADNKFVVYFSYPEANINNLQRIGYTLETANSTASLLTADCASTACDRVPGTSVAKYLASPVLVPDNDEDAPALATHRFETGSVTTSALIRVKIWGINDNLLEGTASAPSPPAATFDEPGPPSSVVATKTTGTANTLFVTFSRSDPKIASAYYYEVKDATGSTVLTSRQANINDVTRDSLDFTTDAIAGDNQRYTVVVKACTGRGTKCSAGIESNPEGVGQPTAPRNVKIQPGRTTLTVVWDQPDTDSTATYTVQIYRDQSTDTFTAQNPDVQYIGLAWNGNIYRAGSTPRYTFTTPTLTLSRGYYRAQVVANHPQYTAIAADSGTAAAVDQRAVLGDPGNIVLSSAISWDAENNKVDIKFEEQGTPKVAETYAVTVYSLATRGGPQTLVPGWDEIVKTTSLVGTGPMRQMTIDTATTPVANTLGPGRYVFNVIAWNAAGLSAMPQFKVTSLSSVEVVVGPPNRPSTTSTLDTVSSPVTIALTPGVGDLADTNEVEVYAFNHGAGTCATSPLHIISNAPFIYTPTPAVDKATYCVKGVAYFQGSSYPELAHTVVHVGTPDKPGTPTVTSKRDELEFSFQCPTIWNLRRFQFVLKRKDQDRDVTVLSPSGTGTSQSPDLVRGTAGPGQEALSLDPVGTDPRLCKFKILSSAIPNAPGATRNAGQYQITLQALNNAVSSSVSGEMASNAFLGDPAAPTSVRVTNSGTTADKITIEMAKPDADVHGGFVLRLRWLRGDAGDDVTSITTDDGTNLYIRWDDTSNVDKSGSVWKVSFPLANMRCGGASCNNKGRFKVAAFAALSRFNGAGDFLSDANYKSGKEVLATTIPTEDVYFGNPDTPANLAIVNNIPVRILNPSATTLDMRFDVPNADVASKYEFELYFFTDQGDTATARTIKDAVEWDDLGTSTITRAGQNINVYTFSIDLTSLDCDPSTPATKENCGAGSYRLKSFKAVTRVSGGQDSGDASLTGLTDVIIVGGTPAAPANVHVPNVQLADSNPGDTEIFIEVDLPTNPAQDNIMGWVFQLQYIPRGHEGGPVPVEVIGAQDIFVQRTDATVQVPGTSRRLKIPVPPLSDLDCATFTECNTEGGRFQLEALQALSWFGANGDPVQWDAAGRAAAQRSADLKVSSYRTGNYGSPRTPNSRWDTYFYVGSPAAAPTGIKVPDVALASSELKIRLSAPIADLAYSYTFDLRRLKADNSEDTRTVVVTHNKRVVDEANNEFELSIPRDTLAGPGRYKLVSASAESWFDDPNGTRDQQINSPLEIYFIYGSPSEATTPIVNLAAPNKETGPSIDVTFDAPAADVARYYTVDVEYHSGSNVNPNPRTLQPALIARRVVDVIVSDCTMTGTSALQLAKKTITADATLVVRCTTACDTDTTPVFIDATGAYLFTSAICRAATHAGLTVTTPFKLTLSAGGNLPRTFTASTNGGTTSDHLTGFNTAADNWNMALAVDTTPATNTFVVPRSAAPTDGTKLKMTIDLSQANCRDTGTQTCGDGKYVVKQVTAWPWFPTTAYTGGIDGSKTAGSAREAYTFVGHPEPPTGLSVASALTSPTNFVISIDRPDVDTAATYTFVLTKYFPGDDPATPTCSGVFTMPSSTAATPAPGIDANNNNKRTISVSTASLTPSTGTTGCATLLGKYRVTELIATSRFGTGGNKPADASTELRLTNVNSYFYIGTLGDIKEVTPTNQTNSPAPSLTVNWKQDSAEPAKSARYALYRYPTGATDAGGRTTVCSAVAIDEAGMEPVTGTAGSPSTLQLATVAYCDRAGITTLDKGRYKVDWTVQGWTATGDPLTDNHRSLLSEFFFIGTPTAPGTPTLTNLLAAGTDPDRLEVKFNIPADEHDNAEKYTFDAYKVDSPSIDLSEDTSGFTEQLKDKDVKDYSSSYNSATRMMTFYLTTLPKGLYRVRVKSVNPNSATPAESGWSAVVGTGTLDTPTFVNGWTGNVRDNAVINVEITKPNDDVALYYSVAVDYYSGRSNTPSSLSGALAGTRLLACGRTGQEAFTDASVARTAGNSLAVRCPKDCASQAGPVYNDGSYLAASSVCRAAIHAGVITSAAGGAFRVTLRTPGSRATWQTTTGHSSGVNLAGDPPGGTPTDLDMTFEALPTAATAFTIMRWSGWGGVTGVNSAVDDSDPNKLVLPIDLSQAACRKDGSNNDVPCDNGKYLVKSVTAHRWLNGGGFRSGTDPGSTKTSAGPRTQFTFVGNPRQPTGVVAVNNENTATSVQISFARPEEDNAKKYTVQFRQYFPGDRELATCAAEFDMPLTTAGDTDLSDASNTRTITFKTLTGSGCSTLRGKFRVISLTAVSHHTGGTPGTYTETDTTPATYFYIGQVGAITSVSSPDILEAQAGSVNSLLVDWVHSTLQDGYPAKEASYTLKRYLTGDSTGTDTCASQTVSTATLDNARYNTPSTTELRLSVTACATVPRGRYKIAWTVKGNPFGNAQTLTSTSFFYIGNPVAATSAPTVFNDAANSRLRVTFNTPTTDNAEGYKYDLVRVDNPSVPVLDTTTTDGTGYTFVKSGEPTPTGTATDPNTYGSSTNTFYIRGAFLTDGLYLVRVRSHNPLNDAGVASSWSDLIGTGTISLSTADKKPSSVEVDDGADRLSVTFSLVPGALGYRYTVYQDNTNTPLNNQLNVELTTASITWNGAIDATFDIVDSTPTLPDGRYTVAISAQNTDANGNPTWGPYTSASQMSAVGVPTQPRNVVLSNTPQGTGLKTGSLTIRFDAPVTDSGLEYWYALYKADTNEVCYTSRGNKVTTSDTMLTAATKTFELENLPSGDYQVRVGVKNGLTTGASSEAATLCSNKGTATTLDTSVVWSALSTEVVTVDNPGQPSQPTVEYVHGANALTAKFTAPATTRSYTYKVTTGSGGTQVPAGTVTRNYDPTNPSEEVTITISTIGWGPDTYQVTVYAQNAFTAGTDGIATQPSAAQFVGTPGPVSAIKMENSGADAITVKFKPPTPDIAQDSETANAGSGGYRYTLEKRGAGGVWTATQSDEPTGTLGSTSSERSFLISGITDPGLYRVKVWGRIVHPNGKDGSDNPQTIVVEGDKDIVPIGDHSTFMRSGIIGVGTPGVPQVSLSASGSDMTITIDSITGTANALQYRWVVLKDAATAQDSTSGLPALDIPVAAIDPLTTSVGGTYTVSLGALMCGANRDADCEAGTYRVGVIAVNGAGQSNYALTTVDPSIHIMGPPSTPEVRSFVVKANTMDELVATWRMPNTWTATSYSYTIKNILTGFTSEMYPNIALTAPALTDSNVDQKFEKQVTPSSGSGLYTVEVTTTNSNDDSTNAAYPTNGRVVGLPLAGDIGLRSVSVTRSATVDRNKKELSINFVDDLNSWEGGANCETLYEWEVVTSPGLVPRAYSSQTINPCTQCTTGACNGILADITDLPDDRYQVFILAYNQFGYTRSPASNVVTVGTPTSEPPTIMGTDGEGQITIGVSPATAGMYRCQGKARLTDTIATWTVVQELSATSFTITSTDVPVLGSTKRRWAVQCERADDWSTASSLSAPAYAASGAPTKAGKPTLALVPASNGVKFTFAPASPDAVRTYRFVLKKSGAADETVDVAFDSSDLKTVSGGNLEYTWASAPSGSLTGIVRSINGVSPAGVDSDESSPATDVGEPGKPGQPTALSGATGFTLTFSPGTPSTVTAYYFTVYGSDGNPAPTATRLLAATASTSNGVVTLTTGSLKATGINLADGLYQVGVIAHNAGAPSGKQDSERSDLSNLVSLGRPGIPSNLVVTPVGWRSLQVEFSAANQASASSYEYSVRNSATKAVVTFPSPPREPRPSGTPAVFIFTTQPLPQAAAHAQYELRVAAVGAGSVVSNWSSPAVAGLPAAPTNVQLTAGATTLRVTFTASALLTSTDTFAYKLYRLGASPEQVGDPAGYILAQGEITGSLTAAGEKYFDIALDAAASAPGKLKAPAGGYYVEVFAARPLSPSGFEAGTVSTRAGPAALGAPTAATAAPAITQVTSGASPAVSIEWAYTITYSTFTSVIWRIRKASGGAAVASGSTNNRADITAAVSSPLTANIALPTGTNALRGRFTIEVCMANDQAPCDVSSTSTDRWSSASTVFALGAPTAPATVTLSGGATSMTGAFTWPASPDPTYDTLSYRLVPAAGGSATVDWTPLTSTEISARTLTIPGTSVPTGLYRLDMRATANGVDAEYIGSTATPVQEPAYKGVPAAVTNVVAASGLTSITLTFEGAEFATSYKARVLDFNGGTVQDVLLTGLTGSGPQTATLDSIALGNRVATFKFQIESRNPNTPNGADGALSGASNLVIFGKLDRPKAPVLEWAEVGFQLLKKLLQENVRTGSMRLSFEAIDAPGGSNPIYEYRLFNASSSAPVGNWQQINLAFIAGNGSTANPYSTTVVAGPGRYTAKIRAKTALGASAASDESLHSQPEVMGLTNQPSIANIGSGASTIVTDDSGATDVTVLITLPSYNLDSGDLDPQLQLRMDTVEPTPAANGTWTNVTAMGSCDASTLFCVVGGAGTAESQLQVKVTLAAAAARRVLFVARTLNDNGPGIQSAASNTISVGRPAAPTVEATGSATGVRVVFSPGNLLTGDTFKYWAMDASSGGSGQTRLAEATVSDAAVRADGKREFTVPFVDFEGVDVPYVVTVKMVAVNANSKQSPDGSAATPVTVGTVTKPTGVTATPTVGVGSATVTLAWQHSDSTVTGYQVKAYAENGAVMTFGVTGTPLGTVLNVGGGATQLPPGRWQFAVLASNAVSQVESDKTGIVPAGRPAAPAVTGVTGAASGTAAIAFTLASDNLAEQVRVSYAAVGSSTWTELAAVNVPAGADKEITTPTLPTGNWRFRLEAGNAVTNSWSLVSNVWPATTVGLPGKPTIIDAKGSRDNITLVVEQAADATATSFTLQVFKADGSAVTPAYEAPLLSVGTLDANRRQRVVFGTDSTKLGGTYLFKVVAVNSLGDGPTPSEMTSTALAAYMPDAPTSLTATGDRAKATLTFTAPSGAVWYEARALAPTGDSWAVTTASALAPFAPCPLSQPVAGCAALTTPGTGQRQFNVPLAALANLDGRYKFQVRAVDANGVPGEWSAESGIVTVGVPDTPRNLAATAARDIAPPGVAADWTTSNVTLSFVPAWLAEQGYVIEVLDSQNNVLDTIDDSSLWTSCTELAKEPL